MLPLNKDINTSSQAHAIINVPKLAHTCIGSTQTADFHVRSHRNIQPEQKN